MILTRLYFYKMVVILTDKMPLDDIMFAGGLGSLFVFCEIITIMF